MGRTRKDAAVVAVGGRQQGSGNGGNNNGSGGAAPHHVTSPNGNRINGHHNGNDRPLGIGGGGGGGGGTEHTGGTAGSGAPPLPNMVAGVPGSRDASHVGAMFSRGGGPNGVTIPAATHNNANGHYNNGSNGNDYGDDRHHHEHKIAVRARANTASAGIHTTAEVSIIAPDVSTLET
jgi:hypothetical protein